MAYNTGSNPDALPAHAEPDQAAAQLYSAQYQRKQSNPQPQTPPLIQRPYSHSNPQSYDPAHRPSYQSKPPPPLPTQQQQPPTQQYHPPQPPRISPSSSYTHPTTTYPTPQPTTLAATSHPTTYPTPHPTIFAATSPPPQNYGFGPPPQTHHGRPPPASRPPGTPAPGNNNNGGGGRKNSADASLFPLFKAVDKSNTGQLTERELGKALVNGDFTSFDGHTVKMMIRMFDVDKSGSINFEEFCALWAFLASWRSLFDRFDSDGSGSISFLEYTNALIAFGYRLSPSFVELMYTTYDKSGQGKMSFDLFVQSCIILKRMTDVFKKYDEDRDGYITLSFEEFLTEILRQR